MAKLKVLMNDMPAAFPSFQTGSPEALKANVILTDLAGDIPSLFKDTLGDVLTGFLTRLKESALDGNNNETALNLLLTLANAFQNEGMDSGVLKEILVILADVCESSEQVREKFGDNICELFQSKLDHPSVRVRQVAAKGLGILGFERESVFGLWHYQ